MNRLNNPAVNNGFHKGEPGIQNKQIGAFAHLDGTETIVDADGPGRPAHVLTPIPLAVGSLRLQSTIGGPMRALRPLLFVATAVALVFAAVGAMAARPRLGQRLVVTFRRAGMLRLARAARAVTAGLAHIRLWATLPDISSVPIQFTDGQAKVFESLWSFKGEATTAERIMQRAGLDSAKPSDLFKIKQKDKGKPEPEAQHAAYGSLVVTQQRAGLYSMPCAAGALA